jgi:hypothetical protein
MYAIGVFTAFTMAGFGMAKYHHTRRRPGWHYKFAINFSAGALSSIVVAIFAVVKFTEGAWVVVVLFAIFVPALIRLNREYAAEAEVLETVTGEQPPPAAHYTRRTVFVMVDSFDLATLAALRYARSLRPSQIRAVHFVIDSVRADLLREKWTRADRGVALDFIDCPDRRLAKAASDLVEREIEDAGTHVTVILPRRTYSPLLGRLLHDRTADKIAQVVSRLPRSAATIVPYDVPSRVAVLQDRQRQSAKKAAAGAAGLAVADGAGGVMGDGKGVPVETAEAGIARSPESPEPEEVAARLLSDEADVATAHLLPAHHTRPKQPKREGVTPIGSVTSPGKVTVEGRIRVVEIRPVERNSVLAVEISDHTGNMTAMFYGRSHIPGMVCGARVRLSGSAGLREGQPVLINPAYELIFPGSE